MSKLNLKKHIVLAFFGEQNTGKSTAALNFATLCNIYLNASTVQFSMAGFIYDSIADATGGSIGEIHKRKRTNPLTRWMLEHVGKEYILEQDPNTLCSNFLTATHKYEEPTIFIIDDLRRKMEAEFLCKEFDTFLFRVRRSNVSPHTPQPSERDINLIGNYTLLLNDASLDRYIHTIRDTFNQWLYSTRLEELTEDID